MERQSIPTGHSCQGALKKFLLAIKVLPEARSLSSAGESMKKGFLVLAWLVYTPFLMAFHSLADGVYAAALTPMRSDFSCDHKKLASHCFDLIEQGCSGVALFGTTGEGPSFSVAERVETLRKLVLEGFDPKKIILGNGSSGIFDTVELCREALKQGCAALLIAPPSFYKNVADVGVLGFYREIIQRVGNPNLRMILYHIPQFSGVPISLKVIETLCQEFPEIVIGMKESEGNLPLTKSLLARFPGFKVFVGHEGHIIESVHLGGAGAICGIANLYPTLICSLYSQGLKANAPNPPSLNAILKALQGIPYISAAKAVMERREGKMWQTLRPPLVPLDEIQRELFISALREHGLEK
jgi:4-hydroxy-tetrahydrodipicolinate synthase